MQDNGLYKFFSTTARNTYVPYKTGRKGNGVEVDDTAPLPLLIGIGLVLFIGFVILVLICCLCRRRRPSPNSGGDRPGNPAYQRAPVVDGGGGGGVAYPMTTVPVSYPNSNVPYASQPHMGQTQHNYGLIGSGISYNNHSMGPYPPQPPHFGGVPTFPPNQYIPSLPLGPGPQTHPAHPHSTSHSSQASTVSGTTADPLVPTSSPPTLAQHQLQQMQQQHQLQHMPPVSAVPPHPHHPHHLYQQHPQQQYVPGTETSVPYYSPMPYPSPLSNDHAARVGSPVPRMEAEAGHVMTSSTAASSPPMSHTAAMPADMAQATEYTEEK